ncbi:hypothetical protein MP228_003268 [Amoeboaphelidium protococcarum]|nr:hypothetical protein MP228_003268 [Amoeboaphelidium protococcarum]
MSRFDLLRSQQAQKLFDDAYKSVRKSQNSGIKSSNVQVVEVPSEFSMDRYDHQMPRICVMDDAQQSKSYCLIGLRDGPPLYVYGKAEIMILKGSCLIQGALLSASDSRSYCVYSPSSHSLLSILPRKSSSLKAQSDILITDELKDCDVILMVKSLSNDGFDGMNGFARHFNVFQSNTELDLIVQGFYAVNPMFNSSMPLLSPLTITLDKLFNNGESQSWLLCGEKSVGKSTMTRHLVNRLLQDYDSVFYLDCDVGQSEFTPPGLVSLIKISDYILGPPFTHQRPADTYPVYYGHLSLDADPVSYFTSVAQCWQKYNKINSRKCPIVINTCGWMTGIGADLLNQIIYLTQVRNVVELVPQICPSKLNLTDRCTRWWSESVPQKSCANLKLCHFIIESGSPLPYNTGQQQFSAQDHRMLAFTSHFFCDTKQVYNQCLWDFTPLWQRACFWVGAEDVIIEIDGGGDLSISEKLAVINAQIVALESLEKQKREFMGYGVVRSISEDQFSGFFIVTPVDQSRVQKITHIRKSSIELPPYFYFHGMSEATSIPFCELNKPNENLVTSGIRRNRHNILR